jgi:hypothetical protein
MPSLPGVSRTVLTAAILALSLLGNGGGASTLPLPSPAAVEAINPIELRMHLEFLAAPELGGRYSLSPGLRIAGRYLASRLEAYGFRGGGPKGSFAQPFEIALQRPDPTRSSLAIEMAGERRQFALGEFGVGATEGSVEGALVFVGCGVSSTAQRHDDYAGLDVRGKVVVIVPGTPAGVDSSLLTPDEQELGAARAHGAVGALILPSPRRASWAKSDSYADYLRNHESATLVKAKPEPLPSIRLRPHQVDWVLSPLGLSYDQVYARLSKGESLKTAPLEARVRYSVGLTRRVVTSENIVGILDGADERLKREFVLVSAHYDHLESKDGVVYPGADDDGSGTAAVLAIAQAFAAERPRRSIMVVFHAGEELGLLGSEYNADVEPAVPLDQIVADFNIDMIGRSKRLGDNKPADSELTGPDSVYLIGSDRLSQELHALSERTNTESVKLHLDYSYNDPEHPQRFYYRSDHWNYAKHGIPVIFYFSGVHSDYHRPTDTVDKIDFQKMARIARLVFATAWRVANLDNRLGVRQRGYCTAPATLNSLDSANGGASSCKPTGRPSATPHGTLMPGIPARLAVIV